MIDFTISSLHFLSTFCVIELRTYLIMTNVIDNENSNILKKSHNNFNNINDNTKKSYNLMNAINEIAQNISIEFSFSRYNVDFDFTISTFLHEISNTRFTFNSLFDVFLNSTISSNLKFHTFRNTFFNSFQNFISNVFDNFLINFIVQRVFVVNKKSFIYISRTKIVTFKKIKFLFTRKKKNIDLIISHKHRNCSMSYRAYCLILTFKKIKKYQKLIDFLIFKLSFARLIKKIFFECDVNDLRIQSQILMTLQKTTKNMLVIEFQRK